VIGISQSGASPDVASVLAEARRQGRPTIALTNDAASPLAQQADALLPLDAGEERAVAATKTYLNSLGAVALLFAAISKDAVALDELRRMPEILERQIALSLETAPPLDEYRESVGATVVARGVNYGTAFEIALKIRELSGLVVEAYSPADLMHGPIAAIQPGWPVIVVAPTGPARPSVEELVLPLKERGARVIAVSDVSAVLRRAHTKLPLVPRVPEWLSPLTAVIPGQVTRDASGAAARARHRQPARAAQGHADALEVPSHALRSSTRSWRWIPSCSLGIELEEREPGGERVAEVRLGVVRAAEVRAGDVAPAHDELAALEARALVLAQPRYVRAAVRREEQQSARAEHAVHLVAPRELEVGGEVREDGERVDEVEALVLEHERRRERVLLEACERQVGAAPVDRRPADVAAGDPAVEVAPPARDAAAAAAEVEDRLELGERRVCCDRVVAGAPAAQEPGGVARACDADH